MRDGSLAARTSRLSRSIARRQRVARWAKALVLPTSVATIYAGRWGDWAALIGVALVGCEILGILIGESQRCPRCDGRLVTGRGWREQFDGTCSQCGCPID